MKQQVEVVNAKVCNSISMHNAVVTFIDYHIYYTHIQAEVYREDFESERGDREKAVAQKEQYRSEMLSLQKQLQQAKDVLVQND